MPVPPVCPIFTFPVHSNRQKFAKIGLINIEQTLNNFLLPTFSFFFKMLPAGVILVFVLVFLAFCAVAAVFINKRMKAKKSNQRF
jgi:ATPase proteolipid family.